MDKEKVETVIANLDNEFDSHRFIEEFRNLYEREYVDLLCNHIKSTNGIFRAAHSEIGRYLSNNSLSLSIEKSDIVKSENINNYENENQNWVKLINNNNTATTKQQQSRQSNKSCLLCGKYKCYSIFFIPSLRAI